MIIELNSLEKEKTHNIWRDVEDGKGRIHMLVTVSGTTRGDSPSNLSNWEEDLDKMKEEWTKRYVSCCLRTYFLIVNNTILISLNM